MTRIDWKEVQRNKQALESRKSVRKAEKSSLAKQALKAQGRPTGRARLPSIKTLRLRLEAIIHFGVKIRDKRVHNGLCLTCGVEPIYSANHIIPASESLNTRYDPDNIYGGCIKCNKNELHHRSIWALGRFVNIFGAEKIMELGTKAHIKVKWGRADFQEKIEQAKLWLERIQLGGHE